MTLRVRFRPQAITDVDEAANWYEARRPGLGKEFRLALDAVIELIQQNLALYQVAYGAARRAALRRFPYTLTYTASDSEVVIVACTHGRRHQRSGRRRL